MFYNLLNKDIKFYKNYKLVIKYIDYLDKEVTVFFNKSDKFTIYGIKEIISANTNKNITELVKNKLIESNQLPHIIIYFHICQLSEWEKIVDWFIDRLKKSGLYDYTYEIRCGILNPEKIRGV